MFKERDRHLLKTIVKQRGIRWLVHFTHINNLQSILDRGIIPREEVEKIVDYGIILFDNPQSDYKRKNNEIVLPDDLRLDGKNTSCLSIMFPNNKVLWHKRQSYGDKNVVFILLKSDVLWDYNCAFYPINAADRRVRHDPIEKYQSVEAFEYLFSDEVNNIKRETNLKPFLPTDVQAEILVFDTINIDYIHKCVLHNNLNDKAVELSIRYPDIVFYPTKKSMKNIHGALCNFREKIRWSNE